MSYLDLQILEGAVPGEVQQRRWPQSAHNSELVQQAGVEDVGSWGADGHLLAAAALRGPQSPEPLLSHTPLLRAEHMITRLKTCALFLDSHKRLSSTIRCEGRPIGEG